MNPLAAWVLAALLRLEPSAPWADTYPRTAEALASSAVDAPLFPGEDGAPKTAALYVSLAWFEGRFNPRAIDATGRTGCMFQVDRGNLKELGLTWDDLLEDVTACTRAANVLLRRSMAFCASRPLEERLAWYAGGGPTCPAHPDAVQKSTWRVRKGLWLFSHLPR